MANGAGYRQMGGAVLVDSILEEARRGLGGIDVQTLLFRMAMGSHIRLVSNCEEIEDWDISSSGNFTAVEETTIKKTGSTALELVDAGTTKGTFVTLDEEHRPKNENWEWANFLCMWVEDGSAARTAGELTIQIKNGGTWGTELAVPLVSNVDKPEYKCIDISGEDRGNVTGFRFVNQRGTGSSEKVYIDEIVITDLIAGAGDGVTCFVGPVRGPVLPYRMETGSITPGNAVNLENGLACAGAADDTALIGVACCTSAPTTAITATDAAPKEVWVAQAGAVVRGRADTAGAAAGDAISLGTSGLILTEMSTTVEKAFCIALDTMELNADSFVIIGGPFADN